MSSKVRARRAISEALVTVQSHPDQASALALEELRERYLHLALNGGSDEEYLALIHEARILQQNPPSGVQRTSS